MMAPPCRMLSDAVAESGSSNFYALFCLAKAELTAR
jgi:hypothetical protein